MKPKKRTSIAIHEKHKQQPTIAPTKTNNRFADILCKLDKSLENAQA